MGRKILCGEKKSCQNPISAIFRLKKKKKVPMAIKLEGGGGERP